MPKNLPIHIAVVDDHQLFRKALIGFVQKLNTRFQVVFEVNNGQLLLNEVEKGLKPDVILLDLNMPIMDGFATTKQLQQIMPDLKCLVLTMKEDDITLIKLLKAGAKGFLNKDVEPEELEEAILSIHEKGYYYSSAVADTLVGALKKPDEFSLLKNSLNEQELKFLELACSEYTYKEVADIMRLSVKTIDGYRARLFEKLEVKSRVGLVLFAIRNKMVAVE